MIVPFVLFVASLAAIIAAKVVPGLSDLLLLAVPCGVAALYLLLRVWMRPPPATTPQPAGRGPKLLVWLRFWSPRKPAPKWIVVDGSNVLHWKDNTPQLATLLEVLDRLKMLGYAPGVVFDANAGYLISGRYQHHAAMGQILGLPEAQVMVVEKRTQADPIVLAAARKVGARIVTNDRYRDWAETNPEVNDKGHLIRGGYRNGTLWLYLP